MRAATIIALVALPAAALAHGDAQWILDGGYRSAMGTTCCTDHDCHRGGVSNVAPGANEGLDFDALIDGKTYRLHAPKESIHTAPRSDAWFCALPQDYLAGRARCLFLPGSV